jgi:hypothetical protein
MEIDSMDFLEFLATLFSGMLVGVVADMLRNRHDIGMEKRKRLSPYIETAYPIVEKLDQDCAYTLLVLDHGGEKDVDTMLEKLASGLELYHEWYLEYQRDGLKPELMSVNRGLHNYLNGLFVFSQLNKKYGNSYAHERLNLLNNQLRFSQTEIDRFLKG